MATPNPKLDFCSRYVFLDKQLIRFDKRPYLPAIYAVSDRNLVLRCSRQTEKSTLLVNTILFEACTKPGIRILFVSPRDDQARIFSRTRLLPAIEQSPILRRILMGPGLRKLAVKNLEFKNGSVVYIRAAFNTADACRGLSVDLVLVDEFQDIASGHLPVLQETLSHALHGRTILVGTPKSVDNHLEGVFGRSTANEWLLACRPCRRGVLLDERCLGAAGLLCPDCRSPLHPRDGCWLPRNPQARWGEGFWINHLMVPWVQFDEVLERQNSYDLVRFKNEVLGLSSTTGDHIVTRVELEACCSTFEMANSLENVPPQGRDRLLAGIDWGGGGTSRTVLVIGFMRSDYIFQICRFERFDSADDPNRILDQVAERCRQFDVKYIGADGGGNGHVLNRLLLERLGRRSGLWAILYSLTGHDPKQDGVLVKWTVDRTATIGALFSRIKRKLMLFPQASHCGSYLDEFACEIAEHDDINRTVRYTHPATQQDDALHASNYALLLAIRLHNAANQYREYAE